MAKKKYYSGCLLPDIEPLWDKVTYPLAYISFGSCANLGYTTDTTMKGRYAHLVFLDTVGYIEKGSTTGTNSYVAYEGTISAENYIIALDDDCVGSFSSLWPGISTEAWLRSTNQYYTAAAAGEGPHWTSVTLFDSTGRRFLTATAPVDYFDLTSWLTGLALGRTGRPLALKPPEGVFKGCRYGELLLPYELTWDKETLPYLIMLYFPESNLTAAWATNQKLRRLADTPGYGLKDGDLRAKFVSSRGRIRQKDGSFVDPVVWETPEYSIYGISTYEECELIWANYDIYTVNGSLYYTTSAPEKIYEKEE